MKSPEERNSNQFNSKNMSSIAIQCRHDRQQIQPAGIKKDISKNRISNISAADGLDVADSALEFLFD